MARVRSTARVDREGDETEAADTVPISEAMKHSRLVTPEDILLLKTSLLPKQNGLLLQKLIPKMTTVAQCRASLATWTSESPPYPKLIFLRW
jgi:hypothetical protein